MSTTSLGQEERKLKLGEYVFQRRVLLGCTAAIGIGLIIWIVAISTDHWFMVTSPDGVTGIYIPVSRRYFTSSHSGIWKVCRYALTPMVLGNVTAVRNFTSISYSNLARIEALKNNISYLPYIQQFLKDDTEEMQNSTEINETLRRVLFATWVTNDNDFETYRDIFHQRTPDETTNIRRKITTADKPIIVNPTDIQAVKAIVGGSLVSFVLNNTNVNVFLPEKLHNAIFEKWEEKANILYLLGAYAKALDISPTIEDSDGRSILLIPPMPPKKSKSIANGYEYVPFKRCKWCQMFPTDQEINADPSIDDNIIDYNRSEASFAIITVMVMAMGFFFSIYTFRNPRYMFKRLAGGIHFISASTGFVVVSVMAAAVDYEKMHLSYNFPNDSESSYGYGYYLAYFVICINFTSFILFLWYSKKKKGDKAATEELGMADEAINIGR